jgi:hypothetical protein
MASLPLLLFHDMAAEHARGRKFTQAMPNHILGDVNGDMPAPVMNGNRMSNHLRENNTRAAPGPNDLFLALRVHILDFLQQFRVNEWPFL